MQLAVVLLILRTVGKENVNPDLKYFQLPKKKVKISCKSGAQFKCSTGNEEMAMLSKGFVSANTQKNNVRGMQVFLEWRAQRNRAISVKVQQCPENLLDNPDCQKLNFWLSWFVAEVRTTLPSRNIHQILSALQRKKVDWCFPWSKETTFIHRTCDSVYRELHSQGVGTEKLVWFLLLFWFALLSCTKVECSWLKCDANTQVPFYGTCTWTTTSHHPK